MGCSYVSLMCWTVKPYHFLGVYVSEWFSIL